MAKVKIEDVVVVAETMAPYVAQQSMENTALYRSGIISNDEYLDSVADATAMTVRMPFWNDLDGESEGLSDTTALTPDKVGSGNDQAVKHYRGKAWAVNELVKYFAGDDPVLHIYDRIAAYWGRDMQKTILIPTLQGIFGAGGALADSHELDISAVGAAVPTDDNRVSSDAIIDSTGLLGDRWSEIVAMALHSAVFRRFQKLGLIEFVSLGDQDLMVPMFLGREVITDDGIAPVVTVGQAPRYPVYLFGRGAIGMGNATIPTEEALEGDRDSLAGDDIMISRKHFIMHPRGVKFVGNYTGQTPSKADLANPANWDKAWEDKNIRIVRLLVNA